MKKLYYRVEAPTKQGLEHFYRTHRTLADFRRGVLGPYFDGFALTLKENGYAHSTALGILGKCCVFNAYLENRNITNISAVSTALIDPFLDEYLDGVRTAATYSPRNDVRALLNHMFSYLEALKVIKAPKPVIVARPFSWLLDLYTAYMRENRPMKEETLRRHITHTIGFLESLKHSSQRSRLKALTAEQAEVLIRRHFKNSKENVRSMAASLRSFLTYCSEYSHTSSDFSGLVPRHRQYRYASLPKGMEESALERVLEAIDRKTYNGARDYAILMVLMAYGVRAVSACQLTMEDIDWRQAKIRFRAQKGGKEVLVPLLDAVGEALIAWLRHRDPRSPYREIFLSAKAPHSPISSMTVSTVVKHYLHRAGVHQAGRGAHTLRHSWAIRALEHDQPIKTIADALGHRYIDTTYIYAKADLKMLRTVAMPWPGR